MWKELLKIWRSLSTKTEIEKTNSEYFILRSGKKVTKDDVRALRNNNPGNIESGDDWVGLLSRKDMTSFQLEENRFCVFSEPKYGFRAIAKIIRNYKKRYGIDTVAGIITRWAPYIENNTSGYIQRVCQDLGVTSKTVLNLNDSKVLKELARAIALVESGNLFPWTEEELEEGINLALGS